MSTSTNTASIKFYWNSEQKIPHSCPVCGYLLRDKEDFDTYKKLKICTECADTYYYANADAWNAGWRPALEKQDDDN